MLLGPSSPESADSTELEASNFLQCRPLPNPANNIRYLPKIGFIIDSLRLASSFPRAQIFPTHPSTKQTYTTDYVFRLYLNK